VLLYCLWSWGEDAMNSWVHVLFQDILTQAMFSRVQSMVSTQLALQLTHKFQQLDIDGLPVDDVYPAILDQYSADILTVAGIYEKSKQKPDVARGTPPIAGTWHVSRFVCKNYKPFNL